MIVLGCIRLVGGDKNDWGKEKNLFVIIKFILLGNLFEMVVRCIDLVWRI